jgi:hypothetical protein
LVALGCHSRTIPTYRAIFELLGVLGDVQEDKFLAKLSGWRTGRSSNGR